MTVYTCEPTWEAMLTCIYVAWAGKKGHENIRLMTEPIGQYKFFDEYVHVDEDPKKAESVADAVCTRISPEVYRQLGYCGLAYETDALDTIYRVMILGFALGPNVLSMVQYRDVMRFREIYKRVTGEHHHFVEFIRFHAIGAGGAAGMAAAPHSSAASRRPVVFVAHIEPKSRLVSTFGEYFSDRMPSEYWMIIDDVHREVLVHPKNEPCYARNLTDGEFKELLETEKNNDEYTDLWQVFFDSVAIKERANARCQGNLFPLWMRKHAVEFIK